jgi:site-specific recombinase XerD
MRQSDKTIIEYRADYLDWIDVEKGLSNATQENYGRFLDRFFTWLQDNDLADLKPHELSEDHIWNYRIFLARKADGRKNSDGLSWATQQRYLIALRSLLSFFAHRDISSLPHDKVNLPKDDSGDEVRNLTLEQLKKLFSAPDTDTKTGLRDRATLETLFSTGLRISELTSLDKKQITSILKENDPELSITGKGNKTRTVYFSDRAVKWLSKYLQTRDDDHAALFISYRGPAGDDRRLTDRAVQKRVKKYATKAGLPTNTTPHVLRHSFATDLLRKGVDIRVLQEFLGHADISATQIYTHVTDKQLRDIHKDAHSGDKEL